MSKYKVDSAVDYDEDDPFRTSALPRAPKETGADRDAHSDSGSDVEMPGISEILAQKEARESQRAQKERLQRLKLAAIAQQQQKRASSGIGSPPGTGQDSDDDGLDVVPDTMHSVAREEAAARAAAGHTRPSAGRTTQLRFARVADSPQRGDAHSIIPATTESPEKLLAAAAQSTFVSSLARGGAVVGRGKRTVGMTKADLERMVLRSAEAQSEQLRREKEEEWVRRGGRVVGVMEAVGEEKIQELIVEALERSGDTPAEDDGGGDAGSDDDNDDPDYVPIERGSASPQKEQGEQEEAQMPIEEKRANMVECADDDDDAIAEAMAETEVDSETDSGAPNNVHRRRRTGRPRHTIIGSDDEDGPPAVEHANKSEEDIRPPPLSLPDLPSPAFTSTAPSRSFGNTEHPDHDHENDPDVSGNDTDKENRAVVRCDVSGPAPIHGARVLFDDILSARAGMGAALQPSVLPADDDPFAFTPSPAKAREHAMRRLGSPVPKPFAGKRGLSQMFEEEEGDSLRSVPALMIQGVDGERATPGEMDAGLVGFKPVLGGLSQAFEQTQVIPMFSPLNYICIY
jgi:mediator of replication checkpoint protein 1